MNIENRELSQKLVDTIEFIKQSISKISVYDLNYYSMTELYYNIAKKINELIEMYHEFGVSISEEIIKQNECLQYLLNDGLNKEVVNKINQMIADGTMDTIINHNVFNSLNNKIEDYKDELSSQIKEIVYIIKPNDNWVNEFKNICNDGANIRFEGDFETEEVIEITNKNNVNIEVVGNIKVLRSTRDYDQLFIFNKCNNLSLSLNINCNKTSTIGVDYEPIIKLINCENSKITNSYIYDIPYTGVTLFNCNNCSIIDNVFENYFDSGLNIGEGSYNCIVKNNTFTCPDRLMNYGSHSLNIYSRGILTHSHIIEGNKFYDIQSTAIQLTGRLNSEGQELFDVTDVLITNNIINYYGHNAIKLDGTGANIKIENNTIKNANLQSDGTSLNKSDCYGIFTAGQGGRAYSVDVLNNYFENTGQYSLRFSANTGSIQGYVNFKNNICINAPIYIDYRSKVDTVDIVGNRIAVGTILISNSLNTSNINNVNITDNVIKNYNSGGYAIYFVNNGNLNFSNNTIMTSNLSKNPPYFGYISSTNMVVENNKVINSGGSDNKIRTVSNIINKCVFNNNFNCDIYNENDMSSFIKDYVVVK